jgi:D-xylonolactonase
MKDISPRCIWPLGAELGEGPIWHAAERAVYCVDIKGKRIHRLSIDSGRRDSWAAPGQPGFVVPLHGGHLLCGLNVGLYLFQPANPATEQFTSILRVEPLIIGNRLNDGYVDTRGRLWFGTMDDSESEPSGTLYRLADGGDLVPQDSGYVITNGPAMSPDGRTLYHTDTLARIVYAFDVADDGSLARKRAMLTPGGDGYPDGMAVDSEGCLWVAFFGGWRIDRYSPQAELVDSIRFPCANVTKLAFGDDDLCTIYVTTATKGLSQDDRLRQPLAGGLFSFRSPTPGLPQNHCSTGIAT